MMPEQALLAATLVPNRELPNSGAEEELSPELSSANLIFIVAFALFISWLAAKLAGRNRKDK